MKEGKIGRSLSGTQDLFFLIWHSGALITVYSFNVFNSNNHLINLYLSLDCKLHEGRDYMHSFFPL